MPIWMHEPDWSGGFTVTYDYKTEIIPSRSGAEQRIAWRDTPSVSYEFSCVLTERALRRAMADLSNLLSQEFAMPIWNRVSGITSSFSGTTVTMRTFENLILVGNEVAFIWGDNGNVTSYVATVTAKVSRVLTLDAAPPLTVPADAKVYPVQYGRLSVSSKLNALSDRTAVAKINFDVDPVKQLSRVVPAATMFYDGRELVLSEPNWVSPVEIEYASTLDTLDYGIGAKAYFDPRAFRDRMSAASYLGATRAEGDYLIELFRRMRGAQGEFYMPTFMEDMRLRDPVSPGVRTMNVYGAQNLIDSDLSTVYQHIAIIMKDGSVILKKVTDIDVAGGTTSVIVNSDFDDGLLPEDINMICWMPLSRFASDSLVVKWISDTVVETSFTTKSLEALSAET